MRVNHRGDPRSDTALLVDLYGCWDELSVPESAPLADTSEFTSQVSNPENIKAHLRGVSIHNEGFVVQVIISLGGYDFDASSRCGQHMYAGWNTSSSGSGCEESGCCVNTDFSTHAHGACLGSESRWAWGFGAQGMVGSSWLCQG